MSFCSVFLLFIVHPSWSLSSAGLLAGKVTVVVGVGEVLLEEVEEGAVLLEEVEVGSGAVLMEEVEVGSGAVLMEEVEVGAHKHIFRLSRTLNSCDTPYTSTRPVDRSSCNMQLCVDRQPAGISGYTCSVGFVFHLFPPLTKIVYMLHHALKICLSCLFATDSYSIIEI